MNEGHHCGGDAAAYALNALEREEAEAFRAHLATCVVCQDEVQAFLGARDLLGLAAPQLEPPRRLRRRVMRQVYAETQGAFPSAGRRRPALGWRLPAAAAGALAAAAVIAAVILFAGTGSPTRVIRAQVIGTSGTAQLRLSGGRAELIVSHVQPPPAGEIYQVWLKRGLRPPEPTHALFNVTGAGAGDVGVSGDMRGVSEMLVTAEPNGGSRVPTHPPVIVARLTRA